jgi:hypothetical protein
MLQNRLENRGTPGNPAPNEGFGTVDFFWDAGRGRAASAKKCVTLTLFA